MIARDIAGICVALVRTYNGANNERMFRFARAHDVVDAIWRHH